MRSLSEAFVPCCRFFNASLPCILRFHLGSAPTSAGSSISAYRHIPELTSLNSSLRKGACNGMALRVQHSWKNVASSQRFNL
jgi:hypothetical protein